MAEMRPDPLTSAANLYKSGDLEGAIEILEALVRKQPGNAEVWFGLSLCYPQPERKRECLRRVLEIDPDHQRALKALDRLDAPSEAASPEPGSSRKYMNGDAVLPPKPAYELVHSPQDSRLLLKVIAGVLLVGLLGGAILFAIAWAGANQPVPIILTPTITPTGQWLPPTWTPEPPTPQPSLAPAAILLLTRP